MIPETLAHLAIPIDSIQPHPRNVRQGDVGAISESLKLHGQYRPIVVQKSTGHILAGNHTYKAAKALKWKQIAATYVDVTDDQAVRILLMDNRANDLASYDDPALADILKQLMETEQRLEGTGFDPDDLDQVIKDIDFAPLADDANPRLDQRDPTRCPECGFEWRVGAKGEIEPV
jgi:ParB-like chromosome segregation protein Spo0J